MTWQRRPRTTSGGYWVCRAKRREYNQRRSAERVAWVRAKEDTDPIYREENRMRRRRWKRLKRLEQRKQETPPADPRMAAFLTAIRPKGR